MSTSYGVDYYLIKSEKLEVDVLVLSGFIEEPTAEELWDDVDRKLDRRSTRPLIFDVTEVSFFYEAGSSRWGMFSRAQVRGKMGFGSVIVCNRDDDVYQSFILTGETSVYPLMKTIRQALEYFREDTSFRLPYTSRS